MTIVIQNLMHRYGDIDALRGINATAAPGTITAVLGPNAAGKSTLLRCIIGAIKPTSGCVLIGGQPSHALPPYQLAQHLAYVPQRSTVAAAFTVREVVELGRYVLPPDRRRVDDALARMELTDLTNRPYSALSVGQQQRVTLARAMAQLEIADKESTGGRKPLADNRSPHLVLDEPMSAMDLRHVRDVVAMLRELAGQGVTVIIAMHDLTLAASIADDVWLMNDGRMVTGSACDVLTIEQLGEVYGVAFEWVEGRLLTV